MTVPPSPSVDPVRERIAEIKARADWPAGRTWAQDALHDRDTLLAALTAVLELADEATYSVPPSLYEVGTSWVSSEIRRRAAAGLGVTP